MYFTVLANKWGDYLYWNGKELFCTNGHSCDNTRAFWKIFRIREGVYVIHDFIVTSYFPE